MVSEARPARGGKSPRSLAVKPTGVTANNNLPGTKSAKKRATPPPLAAHCRYMYLPGPICGSVVLGAAGGGAGASRGLRVACVLSSSAVTGADMNNPTEKLGFF